MYGYDSDKLIFPLLLLPHNCERNFKLLLKKSVKSLFTWKNADNELNVLSLST